MSKYNNLTKTELLAYLDKQNKELLSKQNELESKQQQIVSSNTQISNLKNQLEEVKKSAIKNIDEMSCPDTPVSSIEDIFNAIIALPKVDKQLAPFLIRTTELGIKAYTTLLYGDTSDIQTTKISVLKTKA